MKHLRLNFVYMILLLLLSMMLSAQADGNFGNTNGNLLNNGMMATKDGIVYYTNKDKGGLYKIKADGTQNQVLIASDEYIECINISGNHIYFLVTSFVENEDEDESERVIMICRTDLDGKNRTEIIVDDSPIDWFMVANGYIYYTKITAPIRWYDDLSNKHLYRTDLDGENSQKIAENTYYVNVTGDNIYYIHLKYEDDDDTDYMYVYRRLSGAIHKINLNGTDNTTLKTEPTSLMVADEGWIYYLVDSDKQYLYRIKTDGTENTQMLASDDSSFNENRVIQSINVGKDALYCHYDLGEKIFLSKDGKMIKRMSFKLEQLEKVYILNDNMYYFKGDTYVTKFGSVYKINSSNDVVTKISDVGVDDYSNEMVFIDGWLYYMRPDDSSPVNINWYKVKTDGTQEVKFACEIIEGKTDGQYVYYSEADGIYRCDLDSNTGERIFEHQRSYQYMVSKVEDGLLYCYDSYEDIVITMNLDGSNVTKLSYKLWATNKSNDGFIYYTDKSGAIVKMKPDGSQKTILHNTALLLKKDLTKDELRHVRDAKGIYGAGNSVYVTPSYIYYNFAGMGASAFCRVTHDGKTVEKISNKISYDFKIANGWIYYTGNIDEDDYGVMYKMSGNLKTKSKINLLPEGARITYGFVLDDAGNLYYSTKNEDDWDMYLYKADAMGENNVRCTKIF